MIERHCKIALTPTGSNNKRFGRPRGVYERRLPANAAGSMKIIFVSLTTAKTLTKALLSKSLIQDFR